MTTLYKKLQSEYLDYRLIDLAENGLGTKDKFRKLSSESLETLREERKQDLVRIRELRARIEVTSSMDLPDDHYRKLRQLCDDFERRLEWFWDVIQSILNDRFVARNQKVEKYKYPNAGKIITTRHNTALGIVPNYRLRTMAYGQKFQDSKGQWWQCLRREGMLHPLRSLQWSRDRLFVGLEDQSDSSNRYIYWY